MRHTRAFSGQGWLQQLFWIFSPVYTFLCFPAKTSCPCFCWACDDNLKQFSVLVSFKTMSHALHYLPTNFSQTSALCKLIQPVQLLHSVNLYHIHLPWSSFKITGTQVSFCCVLIIRSRRQVICCVEISGWWFICQIYFTRLLFSAYGKGRLQEHLLLLFCILV